MKAHFNCLPQNLWDSALRLRKTAREQEATLAGGTALALRLGHRISVDLDFFCKNSIRHDSLLRTFEALFESTEILLQDSDSLVVHVTPKQGEAGLKLSFFRHEYPFLDSSELDGVRIASTFDIAAMKLVAISQRGLKRDFVDLYRILQEVPFFQVADRACARYGAKRINPLVIGKALTYFVEADGEPDPEYPAGHSLKWGTVRSFFRKRIRQMVMELETAKKG